MPVYFGLAVGVGVGRIPTGLPLIPGVGVGVRRTGGGNVGVGVGVAGRQFRAASSLEP